MAAKKKQEIAVMEGAALLAEIDVAQDAGAGLEEVGTDDQIVPRLTMVQASSNKCKPSSPAYVEGLEPGMIHDTVTGRPHSGDEGVTVIPCAYQRRWLLKDPPLPGQFMGFTVAEYRPDDPELRALMADAEEDGADKKLPNGQTLIDSRRHFVLMIDADTGLAEPRVIDMIRSSRKHSKAWNAKMLSARLKDPKTGGSFAAPSFAQMFALHVATESGGGNEYFVWKAVPYGFVNDPDHYRLGKAFCESVTAGEVAASAEEPAEDTSDEPVAVVPF